MYDYAMEISILSGAGESRHTQLSSLDVFRVIRKSSIQLIGVNLLLETIAETPITQSDPVFIDQAAMRAAQHSFSVSQSVAV